MTFEFKPRLYSTFNLKKKSICWTPFLRGSLGSQVSGKCQKNGSRIKFTISYQHNLLGQVILLLIYIKKKKKKKKKLLGQVILYQCWMWNLWKLPLSNFPSLPLSPTKRFLFFFFSHWLFFIYHLYLCVKLLIMVFVNLFLHSC